MEVFQASVARTTDHFLNGLTLTIDGERQRLPVAWFAAECARDWRRSRGEHGNFLTRANIVEAKERK